MSSHQNEAVDVEALGELIGNRPGFVSVDG
jgi:hypothetical protein